ncbi:PAS domain-containing sensor histidine kinase [Pseudomonas sp. KU43P]|uniref:PAS domain-containing sensor histidine kinase n=1 Tax=Pseudomonas sp. KU43P TaxID=2487887 RepID=UPI0012AA20CA|nr:PAS domain-containing sensor histidine kinase [Pseudomonas sp. KU43P]BBH46584.1 two-component system sensor histidine kinase/response regulator [Pseudomonas sp. KU43P]
MPADETPPTFEELQAKVAELESQCEQRVDQAQANGKLLGELVDHSAANVFAADCNLRLLAINRTAQETLKRFYGLSPQVGDYILQFLAGQPDIKRQLEPMWPRVLLGKAFIENVAIGERHYEMRFNPLRDAQRRVQGGYLFAYDITERVIEQQRLRETEEALRQSQKMEAVGQLTGGIAHDFNNLLGGILAALEMAEQRQAEHRLADSQRLLATARHNTQRAATLVQRLLAFARQQKLVPQAVDVKGLVSDMRDLIDSSFNANITFVDETLAGQWRVRVDPPQLENALLNLCLNARDAMPMGGTLRIGCENTPLDHDEARALDLSAGDYLRITLSDTGVGMTDQVLQRALEPFFTTKPLGQGSGLGLSIVYGFIRQSGGQLRISSEPRQGTQIALYLPRDNEVLPVSVAQPTAAPTTEPGRHRVMLVEDQDTLRLLISEVLEESGHEVHAFADGQSALKALHTGLHPDLLITDIGLPKGVDGRQLAATCLNLPDEVAVLFITGYSELTGMAKALPDSRTEILYKPFALAVLKQHVDRLLEKLHGKP